MLKVQRSFVFFYLEYCRDCSRDCISIYRAFMLCWGVLRRLTWTFILRHLKNDVLLLMGLRLSKSYVSSFLWSTFDVVNHFIGKELVNVLLWLRSFWISNDQWIFLIFMKWLLLEWLNNVLDFSFLILCLLIFMFLFIRTAWVILNHWLLFFWLKLVLKL